MKHTAMLTAFLALGACKVERTGETATTSAQPQTEATPDSVTPPEQPGDEAAEVAEAAQADLPALLGGAAPTMPAAIAPLAAGQSRAQVRELAPGLRPTDRPRFAEYPTPEATWRLRFDEADDGARLIAVTTTVPRRPALDRATASWGKPQTATDGNGNTTFFWFNPGAKLRATLGPTSDKNLLQLEIAPYLSAAELDGQLGLGSGKLLGLTRAQIEAEHGEHLRRIEITAGPAWTAHLWYPASRWSPQPTLVQLESDADGEAVERVTLELPFLHLPKLQAGVFAELVELWGQPTSGDAESPGRFEVGGAVMIATTLERGRWLLAVRRK